jgi:4-hydroxy-tetrahydrodipicolinate reductase
MRIALLGYGKMGQLIAQLAPLSGHQISVCFSTKLGLLKERLAELEPVDLAIDFSHASAVLPHLELCLSLNKPVVIGTTGWEAELPLAKKMVQNNQSACLYAPNFSIGVYLFQQLVTYAATLFQPFSHYDVGGVETHHRHKQDQPSGTAKMLTQQILQHMPRLQDFNFSSVRCGSMPGTHTLYFDSTVDTLTLTHQARTREGFAQGALLAAEWLLPRQGFFTLEEMMQDVLKGGSPCH